MKSQKLTHILAAVFALGFWLTAQTTVASPDRASPEGTMAERTSAVPAAPDVSPPPDGGYPGFTTTEGAGYNTGLDAGTLALNTGEANTASGVAALILNAGGTRNTANGAGAMVFNTAGNDNSGVGYFTLYNNDTGNNNSALGSDSLVSNTSGDCNTAIGQGALLMNTTGDENIAVGCGAGSEATTGSNNIYIGNPGVAGESNTIRIGDPAIHFKAFIAGIPVGGLAAILFDYNSGTIAIGVGGAVPFNQSPLVAGTAITKTDKATFTVNGNGVYRASYTLRTALLSLLGAVQVQVNGSGVGPTSGLVVAGVPLTDQVTFPANAGDALQLVVSGLTLTLAAGDNATINIDKVQ